MSKELDNAFKDVRNAFRLLYAYQSRVLEIVGYIREHTLYTDMWGKRLFCNPFRGRKDCPDKDYKANLYVWSDMWAWDFMYNYMFEYYFGQVKIGRKIVEMSVIQVSDDGYYRSTDTNPVPTNISSFLPADGSNSYLVFTAGWNLWLCDDMNDNTNYDTEEEYARYLHRFLAGSKDQIVYITQKGHWCITKRYPMQRFSSQKDADKVLNDFRKLIFDQTGIELFNNK